MAPLVHGAPGRPKVSVLTAVYNGERWLAEAAASVRRQSLQDFEFVIVDDGSTDRTPQIVSELAAQDRRIRSLRHPENRGPSAARNLGLESADSVYIATLDADDLMAPRRLELQAAFLDGHPQVGVAGCQLLEMDSSGAAQRMLRSPTNARLASWCLLFQTPVLNSGAMFRRSVLRQTGGYAEAAEPIEDYDLMARVLKLTDFVALPECLGTYRRHGDQLTARLRRDGESARLAVLVHTLLRERLGRAVTLADAAKLYAGARGASLADEASIDRVIELLGLLLAREQALVCADAGELLTIERDCAARLLVLGWRHRLQFRRAAKAAIRQSLRLDPAARHRAVTREKISGRPAAPLRWS